MKPPPEPHRFERRDDTHPDHCRYCGEPREVHPVFNYDPATNAWLRRFDATEGA